MKKRLLLLLTILFVVMLCLPGTAEETPAIRFSWKDLEIDRVTLPLLTDENMQENGPVRKMAQEEIESGAYGSSVCWSESTGIQSDSSYDLTIYAENQMTLRDMICDIDRLEYDWSRREHDEIFRIYLNECPCISRIVSRMDGDSGVVREITIQGRIDRVEFSLNYSVRTINDPVLVPEIGKDFILDVFSRIRIDGEPVEINDQSVPFVISGPEIVYPDTKAQYSVLAVSGNYPLPGDIILTAEGAELDAEGYVTIADNAQAGDAFKITASSAEAGASFTLTVTIITENPLKDLSWTEVEIKGVTIPLLTGKEWNINDPNEQDPWEGLEYCIYGSSGGQLGQTGTYAGFTYNIYKYTDSSSIPNLIKNANETVNDWTKRDYKNIGQIYISGYPAVYGIRTEKQKNGYQYKSLELYARMPSMQLNLSFSMSSSQAVFPPVTPNFLLEAIPLIKVNGTPMEVSDQPDPFVLSGPSTVYPGTSVAYTVLAFSEKIPVPGDVKLSIKGADLDAEGKVIIPDNAKPGDTFTITASSDEAALSRSLVVTVSENPLLKLSWTDSIESDGFTIPMPAGKVWSSDGPNKQEHGIDVVSHSRSSFNGLVNNSIWLSCSFQTYLYKKAQSTKVQDILKAVRQTEESWDRQIRNRQKYYDEIGRIYINGLPVAYAIRNEAQNSWYSTYLTLKTRIGIREIHLDYYINTSSILPPIGPDFLEAALSELKIEGQPVEIIAREGIPSLSQVNGVTETVGGAKIQYTSGDPDPVFGKVIWEVTGEDGSKTKAATVDKKGLVTAGKAVKEITKVIVKARYENCSKASEAALTVYPPMKKLNIVASDTFLYVGSSRTITLTASPDPEGSKLMGLTWKAAKEGLAEIQDNGDGTVTLTPAAPGALTVTATEAGGVKGTVKITVTDKIVTAVEIAAKGAPAPGKAVTLTAKLTPAAPARKDVTWSIDVDETIAKIDAKGKLTIAKDAPAGTVITVTCTALGAPEPVEAKLELTVE